MAKLANDIVGGEAALKIFTKFRQFFAQNWCVEITVFLFMFVYNLTDLVTTNMLLQKACRTNATAVEPDLSTPCDDEERGIDFVTDVNSTYKFGIMVGAIVLTTFATGWSDEAGKNRKQIMVYVYAGHLLQLVSLVAQSYYWRWSPMLAVAAEFVGQTVFLGNIGYRAFCALITCDLTSCENRTVRLIVVQALETATRPISSAISGYAMHAVGFFWTYAISTAFAAIGFCFALFIPDVSEEAAGAERASLRTIVSVRRVVNSFRLVFGGKTARQRILIITLLLITVLGYFGYQGEITVLYLYMRHRFEWKEEQYGVYLSYKICGSITGMVLASLIFSKIMKIHDAIIGMTASIWDTAAGVAYLVATESWQLYLIPLLDIFHGVALSIGQAFATKLFNSNELGQFSSVSLIFCLLVPLGVPAYNILFHLTMDTFTAAIFLLSIPINATVCILYGISYLLIKK